MEVVERDEVSIKQAGEETEVDAVRELGVQLIHLQVDLVQVLVNKSYQTLLHHLGYKINLFAQ